MYFTKKKEMKSVAHMFQIKTFARSSLQIPLTDRLVSQIGHGDCECQCQVFSQNLRWI